jgi:signal transduction histidine kinase
VAATKQSEAANAAKGEFLAAMSHELRRPLASIRGEAELMALTLEQAQHREMAGRIAKGATHRSDLLTDILDLSKVEPGAMPPT